MTRAPSEICEICNLFPVSSGLGFPLWPGIVPELPDILRGACIWVCAGKACELAAQKRALRSAARFGVTLAKIWRHVPAPSKGAQHGPV
ncbi:hypothetical protein [Pelagimonas varians]|uniref:hypothetical protein n=1 Tax=Pelagimonas varians TaxID=696760 RepID=UPI000BEF192D|nr:hypothetical protein [Pelagimonas varians]PYG32400.1 hypothetical protein C8N36_103149 [Pelagimonas varians]